MMLELQFHTLNRASLDTFAAWFVDAELNRRVCAPTEQWFDYITTKPENSVWLVYEGSHAVGQIQLDTYPNPTGSVTRGSMSLVVRPDLRSRGYGKRILTAFLRQGTALCLGEIEACIEADNSASLHCFRACGFVARDAEPDSHNLITLVYPCNATP